jgi:hypothetical protein
MSKHILLLENNAILKDESFRGIFVNGEGLSANKILARTHQNLTDELSSQHRQCRRIPLASESKWIEREYQYIFCGKSQSYDPTIGFETGTSHFGTSTVSIRVGRSSVLVARILSFLYALMRVCGSKWQNRSSGRASRDRGYIRR